MTDKTLDWSVLKRAAILLGIAILLSCSLVGASHYFEKKMLQEYHLFNGQFNSISKRYLAVEEEKKLIKQYLPEFIALYEEHILGKERRLDWHEMLSNIDAEVELPGLSFNISSQEKFQPAYQVDLGSYQLFSTTMDLNLKLLHEGDLFRVFTFLDDAAQGAYTVKSCDLTQSSAEIIEDIDVGNITASCELHWYTVKLASGEDIEV